MSLKAPPAMAISRTPPSKPASRAKLLRKVSRAEAVETLIEGDVRRLSTTCFSFGAKALFGDESLTVVVVIHGSSLGLPMTVVVQPLGSAGAVTPSKLCANVVTRVPVLSWNPTLPRSSMPSASANVARITSPHGTDCWAENV